MRGRSDFLMKGVESEETIKRKKMIERQAKKVSVQATTQSLLI